MADFILLHHKKDGRPWLINRDLITDLDYVQVTTQPLDPKEKPTITIHAEVSYGGFAVPVHETPEQVVLAQPYSLKLFKALKQAQAMKREPDSEEKIGASAVPAKAPETKSVEVEVLHESVGKSSLPGGTLPGASK